MSAREELERVIRNFLVARWPRNVTPMPDCFLLAQAILDAGYRRVEDMEIDEEKVKEIICNIPEDLYTNPIPKIAKAIAEAKGIIRVKEGK